MPSRIKSLDIIPTYRNAYQVCQVEDGLVSACYQEVLADHVSNL